jgi:HlyD family secretion protein
MKKDYGEKMNKKDIYIKLKTMMAERPAYAAGAGIILMMILIAAFSGSGDKGKDGSRDPLYTVEKGSLTISIKESGTTRDKDEIILKNEAGASLKIATLLDEGTMVQPGDLILELDSTELEDDQQSMNITVKNAEAKLIAADENLAITKNQAKANVDKATLDYKFAKLAREKYIKGLQPQDLEKAEATITLAEENLQRAEQDYNWSKQLHDKGFITKKELDTDKLSVKQRQIALRDAELTREILIKYTHPEETETVKANVEQGEMALERAERKAKADIVTAEANMLAQKAGFATLKKKLAKLEEQLVACNIIAPTNGMVVHATTGGGHRHAARERMEIGTTVFYRQELVRLSGQGAMIVEMSVQEASRPKLKENMRANIKIDALPGQRFSGKVSHIGILPDSAQGWLNPDLKVYACEVELDGTNADIRPGMKAEVEIIIEQHENAFYVPLQCVLRIDGKPTVFVKKLTGYDKRAVETGLDNSVMIHILSGLNKGEKVMLAPPLEEAIKKNGNGKHPTAPSSKPKK